MVGHLNFQSESKKSGDQFESLVLQDLDYRKLKNIQKNVYMAGTGCEVDFVAYTENGFVEHIEAKGGEDINGKRPGAQRTDNVKKAIANGALMKAIYPDIYYVVYFSAKPITKSYSAEMIDTALCHKIIDEVRYINNRVKSNPQLELFSI